MAKDKKPIRFSRLSSKVLVIDGYVNEDVFKQFKNDNSKKLEKVTTLRYDSGYVGCKLDLPKIKLLHIIDAPNSTELSYFRPGFIGDKVPSGFIVNARGEGNKANNVQTLAALAFGYRYNTKGMNDDEKKKNINKSAEILGDIKKIKY